MEDYERNFKSYCETSVAYGAAPPISKELIKEHTTMITSDPANLTSNEIKKVTTDVMDMFLGCMLISSTKQKKFGGLKKDLHNHFLMGRDTYPGRMETAKQLMAILQPS